MRHTILFVMALTVMSAGAQTFIPMKKGTVLEYKYYNNKGKQLRNEYRDERWLRFTVDEVWGDTVANITVENENIARFAVMNKPLKRTTTELAYGDVSVTAAGVTFDNMRWLFPQVPSVFHFYTVSDNGKNYTGGHFGSDGESYYRVELSAASFLPHELHVGDKLPDEQYRALFVEVMSEKKLESREQLQDDLREHFNDNAPPASINIDDRASIINRRVEAFENVSVPAGVFECWKISYELVKPEFKVLGIPEEQLIKENIISDGPPEITKYIDYISPEVGLVKREKLNFRRNKAEETMVLTTITE